MGKVIRFPGKPLNNLEKSKEGLTDNELFNLLCQYSRWYYLKFKHVWNLSVEQEDIFGELAVKAMEAKPKYKGKSSLRTFYIRVFQRHMENYRQRLYLRQVKYPILRVANLD